MRLSCLDTSQGGSPEVPDRQAQFGTWLIQWQDLSQNWFILFLCGFVDFLMSGIFNKSQLFKMDVLWNSNSPSVGTSVDFD